jgi:hypothetical protein
MVTYGDRKTNNFGKLVRQKVGLFSKVGQRREGEGLLGLDKSQNSSQ